MKERLLSLYVLPLSIIVGISLISPINAAYAVIVVENERRNRQVFFNLIAKDLLYLSGSGSGSRRTLLSYSNTALS